MQTEKEINIIALSDRDSVRTRTGMYFGSTEDANIILREIIDNAIDECFQSACSRIDLITNLPDGWRLVADWGRGMPITLTEAPDGRLMTQAEMGWSILHAGSKFSKDTDSIAVGMNGVGSSGTNFTSSHFIGLAKVTPENHNKSIEEVKLRFLKNATNPTELYYFIEFEKGVKVAEGCRTPEELESWLARSMGVNVSIPNGASTVVIFQPDEEIWESIESEYSLSNLKYTTAVLEKFYKKQLQFYKNGELQTAIYTPKKYEFMTQCKVSDKVAKFYITFEVANDLSVNDYTGSINSLKVPMGLHMNAAREAYSKALKTTYNIQHDNLRNGLCMDVICVAGEVDFSSQSKTNCVKIEGLSLYELARPLEAEFRKIIKSDPEFFDLHVEKLNQYAESLSKISAIQKVKSLISTVGGNSNKVRSKLPESVKDCTTNDRKSAELYICEGRSASGSIVRTRDVKTQSVFELRGVMLNSVGVNLDDIMKDGGNEECKAIISVVGGGVDAYHKKESVRYGKIIIACDADADGIGHIAPLVLGLIASQMSYLIDMGCVYVLNSPLYKQDGKYIYPGELEKLDKSKPFKRFKGLGELTQQEAYETLTCKETRRLIQITRDDVREALALLSNSYIRKKLMIDGGQLTDIYNTGNI